MAFLIADTAVGYFIEKVDMVLVGAESVFENGGIMNQIGTYQMSICAKAARKPFYVIAETYKFVKIFPLNQYELLHFEEANDRKDDSGKIFLSNPTRDYTPPEYISLLFTDVGVQNFSGISEALCNF